MMSPIPLAFHSKRKILNSKTSTWTSKFLIFPFIMISVLQNLYVFFQNLFFFLAPQVYASFAIRPSNHLTLRTIPIVSQLVFFFFHMSCILVICPCQYLNNIVTGRCGLLSKEKQDPSNAGACSPRVGSWRDFMALIH